MVSIGRLKLRWRAGLVVFLAAGLILALTVASAGAATTLTVSTTADSSASGGACGSTSITTAPSPLSLREATCLANNIGGEVNISVPAGEYKLSNGELGPGIKPGQTINITGAGAATTVIDAQGLSRVLDIDLPTLGGVNMTIVGVTITGGVSEQYGGAGILDGSVGQVPVDELTLESVVVKGNVANPNSPTSTGEPGGGVGMSGGQLNVFNSTFEGNRSYGSPGAAIVTNNNANIGGKQNLKIVGSTFRANRTDNVTATYAYSGAIFDENFSGSTEITESSFINNESNSTSNGGAVGAAIFSRASTPLTVTRSTFIGNKVASTGGGTVSYSAIASERAGQAVTLHYNRFSGNNTSSAIGGAATFDATENWWGCNGGPGSAGCDGAGGGSGSVTTNPRLELHASASPVTLAGPNATSTLSADFFTDSAGGAVSAANLAAFNGAAATWSDPQPSPATINGKAAPQTSTTNFAAGKATATYNSASSSGAGHAVAAFDNETKTIGLTVDRKPEVTTNPSDQQVQPGATASFSAAASGTPTPTVQWQRETGSGTFTNIAGATSTTYSFTAQSAETGYRYRAVFTNTIEGAPYTATTSAATLLVGKLTPTLTSTATGGVVDKPVHDTANLSGGSSPTGTIEFKAFAPGDTSCTGTAVASSSANVTGAGPYESGSYTPGQPGEYHWTATYSGDSRNEEVKAACGAANETSVVTKATPALATAATSASLGGEVHDSATVSGGYTPGGTIEFKLFAPGDTSCATAISTSTVAVSGNGSYESKSFAPGAAGAYRWIATYSGDANNQGAAGTCGATGETSTVAKASATISTTASTATVGSQVRDTATLSGGIGAAGTIEFKAFAPGDTSCTTAVAASTVAVSGNGSYESKPLTATKAGGYRWIATYSGDANNEGAAGTCGEAGETSSVAKATPSLGTAASSATFGGEIHDTATVSGGYTPGGTITFQAFAPGDTGCATAISTSTVAVSGNGSYESKSFAPSGAGAYRWIAAYSGDANNEGTGGACGDAGETSSVGKTAPSLSTGATDAVVGNPVHDTATLSGGVSPGGTITFQAFVPGDTGCATPVATSTVAVTGNGSYESEALKAGEVGAYRWIATYSGDANNEGAGGACGDTGETSSVTKASPAIATTATNGIAGAGVHDTATLSAGVSPVGIITFDVYGPGNPTCSNAPVKSLTVAVNGNGSYQSGSFTPGEAGEYHWIATYSGDGNNESVAGTCGDTGEASTVGKASPTLSTAATDAVVGNPIDDVATLGGGAAPGGSITFEAFAPGDPTCAAATPAFTDTVTVTGNGSYEPGPFTPTAAGAYRWIATYSGDANNNGTGGVCGDAGEASTVSKASPTLSTVAANAALGNPIHDSATLGAGYSAGGSITFVAFAPGDSTCTAAPVFTATVTVTGNGSYESGAYTPAQVGEYRWVATYSGDANNGGAAGTCGDAGETSTVARAAPTLSTQATDTTVGGVVHDTATLTGGQSAGGSITFEAFGPGDASCTGTPVSTDTVTVSGDGSYASAPYTAEEAGAYHWVASYSGDSGNLPTESSCGDAGETSTVAKASPTIATAATGAMLGGPVHDTATLAGGHSAGGTITFKAYGPDDSTCTGIPAFTDTVVVAGSGSYESRAYTPSQAGAYRWIATYSGDANNQGVAGACGDAAEISTVAPLPVVPTNPVNPVPPKACTPPAPSAGGYVPKQKTKGHLVPGVRARVRVAQPSEIEVAATLLYREDGSRRSVDLGTVTLENPGARNIRLPLPASLREALPLGTKVRLSLRVSTAPAAGCSATTPHQTSLVVQTKVLRILVAG